MRTNLIQARKNARLTQAELAVSLEVSEQHYQRLEAGTSNGSISIWQKLSKLYQQPIDFLLQQEISGGGDTPPDTPR